MPRVAYATVLLLLATSCSFVLDGSRHEGSSPPDAGPGGMDASGGDGGGVDAGPQPILKEQFCEELAAVFCDGEMNCCTSARPRADCIFAAESRCTAEFAPAALDMRTGYDPDVARQVVDEGRALAAACDEEGALRWAVYRVVDVFTGTTPGGAQCETALLPDPILLLSCVGTNVCRLIGSFWVRQCLPRAAMGERCYEAPDCEPGLYCAPTPEPAHCAPALADGEVCRTSYDCASLFCTGSDAGRQCEAVTEDGMFCSLAGE